LCIVVFFSPQTKIFLTKYFWLFFLIPHFKTDFAHFYYYLKKKVQWREILCYTNLFVMFLFHGDELLFKRRTTLMGKRARLIKHFITTSFFNDAEREGGEEELTFLILQSRTIWVCVSDDNREVSCAVIAVCGSFIFLKSSPPFIF
jgi:hypothetical protein